MAHAEAHIHAGDTVPDVLQRFAQAIASLWRTVTHVSVVLADQRGELTLHALLPRGIPSAFPAGMTRAWETTLAFGEPIVYAGDELRDVLERSQPGLAAVRSRPITMLGLTPLIAGGRILGAANMGVSGRAERWPLHTPHVSRLAHALACRLLDLMADISAPALLLEDMAADSPTALILVGADCEVLHANDSAATLLRHSILDLRGRRICDVLGLAGPDELAHAERCPVSRLLRDSERRKGPREVTLTIDNEHIQALLAIGSAGGAGKAGAVLSIMPLRNEDYVQEQRRKVVSRLLHDLNTPLSGIGLVSELLEPGLTEVPGGIVDAVRMHHADLLRYVSELADYALLDLDSRLPPPQPIPLGDVLEVVVWRLWPYTQRRRQHLHIVGKLERPLLISQRHLEQALTAVVFDVSTYAAEGSSILVLPRVDAGQAAIGVEGGGGEISVDGAGALIDPYLRARPRGEVGGLMSLAASKRMLEHYGGTLDIEAHDAHLGITISAPLA